jgi:hypothetical protein
MLHLGLDGQLIGEFCNCNLADFVSGCDHNRMILHTLFLLEPPTPWDTDPLWVKAEYRIFCEVHRQAQAQRLGLSIRPCDLPN